jgi:hypothetical protein
MLTELGNKCSGESPSLTADTVPPTITPDEDSASEMLVARAKGNKDLKTKRP